MFLVVKTQVTLFDVCREDAMIFKNTLFALMLISLCDYSAAEELSRTLGVLKTNEYIVIIAKETDHNLYTVKSENGTILGDQLSKVPLATKFPELVELVNTGIADDASLNPRLIKSAPDKSISDTYR